MAHVALDDAQVDTGFEEVGGVGVAQGVNRNAFFAHASVPLGLAKGALDAIFGHRMDCLIKARSFSTQGWEEKTGMAVGTPVLAQQMKSGVGQRDIAVLGALAAMDMDHHALAIDIGDFQMKSFVKAQTAGVDGGEIDVVVEGFDAGQNASEFIDAQDSGQAVFVLSPQDREDVPIAHQNVDVKKANPAVADAHGLGRPAVDVFSMEKVVLQLRFRDKIGSLVIELREHTNCAGVGFLSGFSFPIELQHCHHALIPIVHKILLL